MAFNIWKLLGITDPSELTVDMQRVILNSMLKQPTPSPTLSPTPTAIPTQAPMPVPTPPTSFGMGQEEARVEPAVFDALRALEASEEERRNIAELTGQESSYGYAKPHITEKEESYGPVHLNIKAGRINPLTGKPFTKEEAEDVQKIIQYALDEYRRTGGLGAWNPGAYPFYQEEIPKRAETKKFIRGEND